MSSKTTLLLIAAAIYTCILMTVEAFTSQEFARQFFTDIGQNAVPFYAVNTTLGYALLWGAALLFAVNLSSIDRQKEPNEWLFCLSQLLLFFYLGFDERFMVHERLGRWLHADDAYLLLVLGLMELVALLHLGRLGSRNYRSLAFLYAGAFMFGVMTLVDAKLPSHAFLRLSAEDLSKFWGCLFLFLFAWELLMARLRLLKNP